jgi:hypothetical protein
MSAVLGRRMDAAATSTQLSKKPEQRAAVAKTTPVFLIVILILGLAFTIAWIGFLPWLVGRVTGLL